MKNAMPVYLTRSVYIFLVARKFSFVYFMFRPIKLPQLNSLTSIDTFSCLDGRAVTLQTERGDRSKSLLWQWFKCWGFCFVVVVFFTFCPKHIINFVIKCCNSFSNVYSFGLLNIMPLCELLQGYQDTDLAS